MTEEFGAPVGTYFLAKHVFCCPIDDCVVLLDLRSDRYLYIDRSTASALSRCNENEQVNREHAPVAPPIDNAELRQTLGMLLAQGVLTSSVSAGKPLIPLRCRMASLSIESSKEHESAISVRHIVMFILAAIRTDINLRWRGLEAAVRAVTRRRARGKLVDLKQGLARLPALITLFERLRPIYPRARVCLFDSLALFHFLSSYGVVPTIRFGVRVGPCAAHCWLQLGDAVLNDSIERVSSYAPIMVLE
jgi:hypothetical protein